MSTSHTWLCLSVQEFIGQANWDGRTIARKSIQADPIQLIGGSIASWGTLTVQAFFKANNWMGVPLDLESFSQSEDRQTIPAYTATVKDFFKYLPWEGQPAIASLPQIKAKSTHPNQAKSDDLTLVDLSELF